MGLVRDRQSAGPTESASPAASPAQSVDSKLAVGNALDLLIVDLKTALRLGFKNKIQICSIFEFDF